MKLSSDPLPPIANLVNKVFSTQDSLTSIWLSSRIAQQIRCSSPIGHFHKWYLGDGQHCFWCGLCRRFTWLDRIIPYAENDGDETWN